MIAFRRLTRATIDVWLRDLVRGTDRRLTSDGSFNAQPFWSPKGERIVFLSNRGGHRNLYQKLASGSGQDELLFSTPNDKNLNQWSRDGRFIVYTEVEKNTQQDLWVLPVDPGATGDRKPIPFLQTRFNEFEGQLSPDSRWMAYTSDETGQRQVYVRPFPPSEGVWPISLAGGSRPRWRGDGKELFFEAADGKLTAVALKATAGPKPSIEAGAPATLFDAHMSTPGNVSTVFEYDVTLDGKRFLVSTNLGAARSTPPLTVVANWTARLKK